MLYACLNFIQPSKEKELELEFSSLEREDRQKKEKSSTKKAPKKAVVKENGHELILKINSATELLISKLSISEISSFENFC